MFNSIGGLSSANDNEIIKTSTQPVKYSQARMDLQSVDASDELQEKIVRAYLDAGLIRNLAVLIWIFFLVRFIPFIGFVGLLGMLVTIFLVPIKLITWQIKFGRIKTADPDFKRAQRNKNIALLIWSPLGLFVFWIFFSSVLAILFL
jgi:hypothetical protein